MNLTYFIFFLAIVTGTLIITHWAAERSKTTNQFYIASGSLTGFQNGMAIAGDYISAASFLGISGLIAIYGYDGFIYATGFLLSYVILLLLIAEPVHHLGKYSLGDVVAERFPGNKMRLVISTSGIFISILYMIPQLVASGFLLRVLLGVDYHASVWIIGILMTVYVVFGGMVATSWVQIIKTVLLMSGTLLLVFILFSWIKWDLSMLVVQAKEESPLGEQFLTPGNLFQHPIERISLTLSLILGTSGLPHILIRFLTVRNAKSTRLSVLSSTWIIGLFYIMTLLLGIGTIAIVGWDTLIKYGSSGNMAALMLAKALGGDFLVAFVMAVAFATIIAVVTGLIFAATSSFAHDIYFHIVKKKQAEEKEQLLVARITAVGMGFISIMLSLGLEESNVAFLVSLTFSIAASTLFPLLLFTFYWKRFNRTGAYTGIATGFIVSVLLVSIGPWGVDLLSLYNPGIISIPLSFLGSIAGTLLTKKGQGENYKALSVKINTGVWSD
ncbi:solute symporter family protein [Oceanobacillus halophilus]|uniref:Cation acetate symporter n=1 Tax=Oceanobacillus halophilus TaxID=930130 RepID=A0A495ACA7_9BACI|nr:cation acetate symporter [Oceanobacillus halophilus]RKQ37270.1 cation acetate symporter [Oceanobacillus halophilus]